MAHSVGPTAGAREATPIWFIMTDITVRKAFLAFCLALEEHNAKVSGLTLSVPPEKGAGITFMGVPVQVVNHDG